MPRVVHFELPADDPQRAIRFYSDAFGWRIQKWDGPMNYWLVSTGEEGMPGIDGAIYPRRPEWGAYVSMIDVEDIDASIAAVEAAGGDMVSPKQVVPGIGWLAYFKDPEGNPFGMMQSDDSAR
ncbi:MAG: VOC family protein [Chloroflexi bacterium]|nr:VOC family protein [Chloroflexota bacterium]